MNEERCAISGAGMAIGSTMSAADILAARARNLARETTKAAKDDGAFIEVLTFGLADETYALELIHVRRVDVLADMTALPCVPQHILGVTSVHGHIVAVVDLGKILGLAESARSASRQAIILQSDHMEFAVLAERVSGIRRIPLADVQISLPTLTNVRAAYLVGVTQDGTVILSAARLLADPRLVVNQNT